MSPENHMHGAIDIRRRVLSGEPVPLLDVLLSGALLPRQERTVRLSLALNANPETAIKPVNEYFKTLGMSIEQASDEDYYNQEE